MRCCPPPTSSRCGRRSGSAGHFGHLGHALAGWLERVGPRRRGNAGVLHRLDLLLIPREVLFVPGLQVFIKVREVHGRTLFEVTIGPLVGEARSVSRLAMTSGPMFDTSVLVKPRKSGDCRGIDAAPGMPARREPCWAGPAARKNHPR